MLPRSIKRSAVVLVSAVILVGPLPAAHAATWRVDMSEHIYEPAELNITVGDTVTWHNVEAHNDDHTVTSHPEKDPNGPLDSGTIAPGETFSFTFTEAGDFPYFCQVHGLDMHGVVRVRPPGAPFAVDDVMTATTEPETSGPATGSVDVVTNDFDREGDALTVTSYDRLTTSGAVIACAESGDCTYSDPDPVCNSEDSFGYTISDGSQTDSALVEVRVKCGVVQQAGETQVGLMLRKHLIARGSVLSEAQGCARNRLVKVQRSVASGWKTMAQDRTARDGVYSVRFTDRPGAYRAKAPATTLGSGQVCRSDVSPIRRHKH